MPARIRIFDRPCTFHSDTASDSGYSDISEQSRSTAPTDYSHDNRRPYVKYHGCPDRLYDEMDARASFDTYASTVASEEDLDDEGPYYEVPDESSECFPCTAIPSTPHQFAELFPSTRRLKIKHDDSTDDGNMNLRVDTEVRSPEGRRIDLTLFHLRMHDLKNREFSLRRYCRDSGREVCHSSRKYTKPGAIRSSGLQRSMSNALSTLRSKSDAKSSTKTHLKRSDSGYGSLCEDDIDSDAQSVSPKSQTGIPLPTNTTHLEFSNYAHIDIKRRGTKSSKRYEFEYWGTTYTWKRLERKTGNVREVSYYLVDTESSHTIAYIIPDILTAPEQSMEEAKGGWVPPCSFWISDERITTDVADAIVATGLIALVDDCIKARWHRKDSFQMTLPGLMKLPRQLNMEYVGPKRLLDEVFNRRGLTDTRQHPVSRQISAKA